MMLGGYIYLVLYELRDSVLLSLDAIVDSVNLLLSLCLVFDTKLCNLEH